MEGDTFGRRAAGVADFRALVAGLVVVAACNAPKPGTEKMPATGTMMTGDSMMMKAGPMLPALLAHLDSLASATPAMHDAAMADHDSALGGVLRAMRADLMHLGMHGDSAWEALADSVLRDEALIAAAKAPERAALLARHLERVRRLLSRYDAMAAKGRRG